MIFCRDRSIHDDDGTARGVALRWLVSVIINNTVKQVNEKSKAATVSPTLLFVATKKINLLGAVVVAWTVSVPVPIIIFQRTNILIVKLSVVEPQTTSNFQIFKSYNTSKAMVVWSSNVEQGVGVVDVTDVVEPAFIDVTALQSSYSRDIEDDESEDEVISLVDYDDIDVDIERTEESLEQRQHHQEPQSGQQQRQPAESDRRDGADQLSSDEEHPLDLAAASGMTDVTSPYNNTTTKLTDTTETVSEIQKEEVQSNPLPGEYLVQLQAVQLYYPGHHSDYTAVKQAFEDGSLEKFEKLMSKLREKQRVYDQYRSFTRLNELAGLELAYPGFDEDVSELEKWHLTHPPSDENDALFKDKIEGLRNKDALFFGDRSHPNIVALDQLVLTYTNWRDDVTDATKVHCDQPAHHFPDKLHMLREKQRIHDGDRNHWRLKLLDKLHLTYPGWTNDVAQVEIWHLHHADTPQNTSLFTEVIDGMRDQQIIYLGWDRVGDDDDNEEEEGPNGDDQDDTKSDKSGSQGPSNRVSQLIDSMESRRKTAAKDAEASSKDFKTKPRSGSPTSLSSSGLGFESDQDVSLSAESSTISIGASSQSNPAAYLLSSPSTEGMTMSNETTTPTKDKKKKSASLGKCVVCLSRSKTHVFVPCGHMCCCAACGTHAMETGALCPMCRTDADNVFRVFI